MLQSSNCKFCPECAKKNVLSRMKLFQISFDSAIQLCSKEDCIGDLAQLEFVNRKLEDIVRKSHTKRKRSRQSSKNNSLKTGSFPVASFANLHDQPSNSNLVHHTNIGSNPIADVPPACCDSQVDQKQLPLSFLNDQTFWDSFDTLCNDNEAPGLPTSSEAVESPSDNFLHEFRSTYAELAKDLTDDLGDVGGDNRMAPVSVMNDFKPSEDVTDRLNPAASDSNLSYCDTNPVINQDTSCVEGMKPEHKQLQVPSSQNMKSTLIVKHRRTDSEEFVESKIIQTLKVSQNLTEDTQFKIQKFYFCPQKVYLLGAKTKLQKPNMTSKVNLISRDTVFANNISPLNSDQSNASDGDMSIVSVECGRVTSNTKKLKLVKPRTSFSCQTLKAKSESCVIKPEQLKVKPNIEKQRKTQQMLSTLLQGSDLFGGSR